MRVLIVIIYINIYRSYNIYKLSQIKKFQRSFVIFFYSLSLWLVTYRWSIRSMAHQTNGLSVYYILSRFLRPTSLKVNQMNRCSAEIVGCEYISRWERTRIRCRIFQRTQYHESCSSRICIALHGVLRLYYHARPHVSTNDLCTNLRYANMFFVFRDFKSQFPEWKKGTLWENYTKEKLN